MANPARSSAWSSASSTEICLLLRGVPVILRPFDWGEYAAEGTVPPR